MKAYGRIDVLVNNAGHSVTVTHTDAKFIDAFDQVMASNVRSAALLTTLCAPHLTKTKGCIVNMSSILGHVVDPGNASYCISKAALNMLTKTSAYELGRQGVRVNAVA